MLANALRAATVTVPSYKTDFPFLAFENFPQCFSKSPMHLKGFLK